MGNNVSLDDMMLQEALKRSVTSPTSPGGQENGDNNSNSDNDPGEEGETVSEHTLETMMKLVDLLHQVSGGELDSDRQAKHNELQALGFSARADGLEAEFEHTSTVESIGKAVELRNQALALTPEGHVDRAERLRALGVSLRLRFERLGDPADVDKAIEYLTQAVLLTPEDHSAKPQRINSLGSSYARRFECLGQLEDVEKAIEYLNQAVLLIPDDEENKPPGLNDLGNAYLSRFQRLGDIADMDKAIECQTQAVLLTPEGHANKPSWLNNLGLSYERRFQCLGEVTDVHKAIECQSQAVLLTPDGHARKPMLLNNLGNSYRSRFESLGELADVDKAIECQTQALLLTLDGHPAKPSRLSNLGNSYRGRFERLGEVVDVDKAIECHTKAVLLTPDGYARKPMLLNNLGLSYERRFERLGEVADVNKAIEYHSQTVLLGPDGHAGKPNWLNNLGNSYLRRFERLGQVADVDKAIECQTQAVLLTSDGHTAKPSRLSNLGNSYRGRFERLGEVVDLDKAIECQTQAVLLTPDGHANKAGGLGNLGISYLRRFERLGELADVDKAIEYQTPAVSLTPDGHAGKPSQLNNLGISYQSRFVRLGEVADVNKAIEYQTQAVLLTPDGHADKPVWLNNLGNSYVRRFERLGEVSDIDEATKCQNQAVMLTPDGHADRPSWLYNLGVSYMRRFESLSQLSDLESAQSAFQSAAQHIVANPSTQIRCARRWAKCSHSLGTSPLPAYERCMELIPRVIWLGRTISQRYNLLSTISDLVAEAAAWAISVQEYDLAIEWLEQGRSVVWSQILQLRTPFDDLSVVDPSLAQYFTSIATELEDAGTRPTDSAPLNNAPGDQERIAQRHRYLADEWEKALAKARKIPGFDNFMRPRKAEELKRAATNGPVVLINIHSTRCDALIIFPQCDEITHENLLPDIAGRSRAQLSFSTRRRGDDDRGFARVRQTSEPEDPLKRQLGDLWSAIVKPILDTLACTRRMPVDELPHVTWCATGELAFLPLHAAGLYDGSTPNTFDLVISSYAPTLSALLASSTSNSISEVGILAVGQKYTRGLPPLPYTVQELAEIEKHAKSGCYHRLDEDKATVNAVLGGMDEHSWVHLACHASQNPNNPAHSAFHLHDGKLTLEAITKRQYKNKGLAFLSACETAAGDGKLPDEAVHLAAGMLMAGYPSVIATMWPICDADGPEVADRVYAELLKDGKMNHREAARALHKAVAGLREKIGADSFNRWVPFVHIGV